MIRSFAMLALLALAAPAAGASGSAAVTVTILSAADVPARTGRADRKKATGAEQFYRQLSEVDAEAPSLASDQPRRGLIVEFQ